MILRALVSGQPSRFNMPDRRTAALPLFGANKNAPTQGLSATDLKICQATTERAHPELRKYGDVNVEQGYQALSQSEARLASRYIRHVSEAEYLSYASQGMLGPLEEVADLLYEMYAVHAIEQQIIDPRRVDRLVREIRQPEDRRMPFSALLAEAGREFSRAQVSQFQDMTQIRNTVRARDILALLEIKFALHQEMNPRFDMWADSRRNALDEVGEVAEHLAPDSPGHKVLERLTRYYRDEHQREQQTPGGSVRHADVMSHLSLSRQSLEALLQQRLGPGLDYEQHIMQYAFLKQLGRQQLDYENPQIREIRDASLKRKAIKRIHKFFELRFEASLLKDAHLLTQSASARDENPPAGGRLNRFA